MYNTASHERYFEKICLKHILQDAFVRIINQPLEQETPQPELQGATNGHATKPWVDRLKCQAYRVDDPSRKKMPEARGDMISWDAQKNVLASKSSCKPAKPMVSCMGLT